MGLVAKQWDQQRPSMFGVDKVYQFVVQTTWRILQKASGRRRSLGIDRHDIASLGVVIEMQFCTTSLKLSLDTRDALLDSRMVGAVTCDEFLNDRSECRWVQCRIGNVHEHSLAWNVR